MQRQSQRLRLILRLILGCITPPMDIGRLATLISLHMLTLMATTASPTFIMVRGMLNQRLRLTQWLTLRPTPGCSMVTMDSLGMEVTMAMATTILWLIIWQAAQTTWEPMCPVLADKLLGGTGNMVVESFIKQGLIQSLCYKY